MKFSKTQLSNIVQVKGFLVRLLGRLLKTGLLLVENVLKPLAKSILVPLGLTETASATDAVIQKKVFGLSMTILIILTKEVDFIMRIVKSLKNFAFLVKFVGKTTKYEPKEQKGGLLGMLLGTLGASLL